MSSWIHLFSKFTPEALLFESLVICVLVAAYSAFWILRKRRFGVIPVESTIPAGVVKAYLNELIVDAESLRAQLFGLLAGAGISMGPGDAAKFTAALGAVRPDAEGPMTIVTADPGMGAKLAVLEAKMAEQARAMETLLLEKTRLATELQNARTQGAGGAAPVGDEGAIGKLQEKIRSLEGKLEEYSVIEDDLANLKRLQQENASLRASLGQGGTAPAAAAPVPAAEAAPVVATPTPTPAPAPQVQDEPAISSPALEPSAGATTEAPFDALASEVEKSLEPAIAAPSASSADPLPVAEPEPALGAMPTLEEVGASSGLPTAPAGPAAPVQEKSDADLVAEFEKMLNG